MSPAASPRLRFLPSCEPVRLGATGDTRESSDADDGQGRSQRLFLMALRSSQPLDHNFQPNLTTKTLACDWWSLELDEFC